jgi:hypothetical protein
MPRITARCAGCCNHPSARSADRKLAQRCKLAQRYKPAQRCCLDKSEFNIRRSADVGDARHKSFVRMKQILSGAVMSAT